MPDVAQLYPVYTDSPYTKNEGKVLLADRAYVAAAGTAVPTVPSLGVTPAGWTDLGSIDKSYATIEKDDAEITQVTTGLYQVVRAELATKDGEARCRFTMVEYQPSVWAVLTGDTEHVIGTDGTGIWLGGRPIIQKALLLVGQNPVTFAEFMHYNPKVNIVWKIVDIDQFKGIEVTGRYNKYNPVGDATGIARDFELIYFKGSGSTYNVIP